MSTYYTKYDKTHDANGIAFDAIQIVTFPAISVSASQVVGSVATSISIPQDCKIQHVSVTSTAVSASGQPTFQIVSGGAASVGAVGTANAANTNGTPVFSAAQNVPLTANTQSVYNAAVPDAVCDKTLPLTLRVVTASTDTLTGFQVSLALVPVDPYPDSIPSASNNFNNANPNNF